MWGRRSGFTNTQIRGLSVECQFLLCLMILRRDKTYEECSILFGVSETLISQIFKTWLAFLHFKFQALHEYVQSLTLQDLPKPPKAFRNKLLRKVRYVKCCELKFRQFGLKFVQSSFNLQRKCINSNFLHYMSTFHEFSVKKFVEPFALPLPWIFYLKK